MEGRAAGMVYLHLSGLALWTITHIHYLRQCMVSNLFEQSLLATQQLSMAWQDRLVDPSTFSTRQEP